MIQQPGKFKRFTTAAGSLAVIATCFFIPFSTSLLGICSVLAFFFWVVSGKCFALPRLLVTRPVPLIATLLFLLLAISLSYTPVPLSEGIEALAKYRELLFIPIVMSLLANDEKSISLGEDCFVAGCLVLLTISYLLFLHVIPPMKYGNSVLHHITHSFFMALLAFWAMHRMIDSVQYRYFWGAVWLLTTINIAYINPGRTGMVLYLLLMILAFVQRLSLRNGLLGLTLLAVLIGGALASSDNLSSRLAVAVKEVQTYKPGKSRTSLGMRFDWWYNSGQLIAESPLYGHGVGSFASKQQEIKERRTMPSDNPHNEYLFIGVQAGLLGLALLVLLFLGQLAGSLKMPPPRRYLLQGTVLAMAIGCVMNSFLFDSHQGHFYAMLSALYFASSPEPSLRLG